MDMLVLVGTIVVGIGGALLAARLSLSAVLDLIPRRKPL